MIALKSGSKTRLGRATAAPGGWRDSCANQECTLHQLSPYIGKLKSTIAGELIERYTRPGQLLVDPFAGAGTIPLEAVIRSRRAFASDISSYSAVLARAKLCAPADLGAALELTQEVARKAVRLAPHDLRSVPIWVRRFFHSETLREALAFAEVARRPGYEFVFAYLLGILHHQRPGFLSFPSSHLVPYLRDSKYPRSEFPEMYEYRELLPRLLAKVERAFKRPPSKPPSAATFVQSPVETVSLPRRFDAVITSPPYMNALDYGRDNRLRLWFIDPRAEVRDDSRATRRREAFAGAIGELASKVQEGLRLGGYCILVVGEQFARTYEAHPSEVVNAVFKRNAPSLKLDELLVDSIPDVRRARREVRGVKAEHILVYRRDR